MNFSRTFNAWKFVTSEKVIINLPLHTLKPQELMLTKINTCIQGNQIILEFSRSPLHQDQYKGPGFSDIRHGATGKATRNESPGTEYSDKSDPIWR
jgi:hypothetical protein